MVPTFFMRIKIILYPLLLLLSFAVHAQELTAEQAITKVFKVLSGQETSLPENKADLIQNGAWEALAYLDQNQSFELSEGDLQEAVPDYYRFKNKELIFKLINQKNHNEFGIEGRLNYRWDKDYILVLDSKSGVERDRWRLLYVDSLYLALEMGELRVFFTHTPALEP